MIFPTKNSHFLFQEKLRDFPNSSNTALSAVTGEADFTWWGPRSKLTRGAEGVWWAGEFNPDSWQLTLVFDFKRFSEVFIGFSTDVNRFLKRISTGFCKLWCFWYNRLYQQRPFEGDYFLKYFFWASGCGKNPWDWAAFGWVIAWMMWVLPFKTSFLHVWSKQFLGRPTLLPRWLKTTTTRRHWLVHFFLEAQRGKQTSKQNQTKPKPQPNKTKQKPNNKNTKPSLFAVCKPKKQMAPASPPFRPHEDVHEIRSHETCEFEGHEDQQQQEVQDGWGDSDLRFLLLLSLSLSLLVLLLLLVVVVVVVVLWLWLWLWLLLFSPKPVCVLVLVFFLFVFGCFRFNTYCNLNHMLNTANFKCFDSNCRPIWGFSDIGSGCSWLGSIGNNWVKPWGVSSGW